jgi:hypothetical protein
MLTWSTTEIETKRAGLRPLGSSPSLPPSRGLVSPAPREGVPDLSGPMDGAPSCSFCPDEADVVYMHGADLTLTYCGLHAYEILAAAPALMLRGLERS